MFDSSVRAASRFPPSRFFLAVFIIASALRSFGTVSTRYTATAPRIDEAIAVRVMAVRILTALLFPAEFADERHELGAAAVFDLHRRSDARDTREPLLIRRPD